MSNIHAFKNQIYWNENNEYREVKCNKCIPINSFYLLQDSDSEDEEITIKNNNEKIRTKAFYILQHSGYDVIEIKDWEDETDISN